MRHLFIHNKLTELSWQIMYGRVVIWRRLDHPHIAKFRGINVGLLREPALVFDWADKGNIVKYTMSNPNASRLRLVLILFLNCVNYLTLGGA